MLKNEKVIYVMLSAVVTVWGLNVIMVKYLSFFPPVLIAAIRMSIAALALLPFVLWQKEKVIISKKGWLLIGCVSLSSITVHQTLLAWGVNSTSAGNTSLMLGLNPLATALLAVPFLGEKLTLRKLLGIVLGFSGVIMVVLGKGMSQLAVSGWGDLLVFLSMLAYVAGGLFVRTVSNRGVPTLLITVYSQLMGAVSLWIAAVVIYPWQMIASIDTRPFTWFVILSSGVFATALGSLGWNYGIRRLGASRTAIFLNGMPMSSIVFAALLLGEQLQWTHGLALLLIVLGVYLGTKQPEPLKSTSGSSVQMAATRISRM